jgi:hypothetical protein
VSTHGWRATAGRWSALGHRSPGGDQQSPAGCGSIPAPIKLFQIFLSIFIFKKRIFGSLGNGPGAFERMGIQHPHYLKLAPTLGSANSSKIHGEWRFHFFPNKKIPEFRTHLDLHIYCWDFCFMKK